MVTYLVHQFWGFCGGYLEPLGALDTELSCWCSHAALVGVNPPPLSLIHCNYPDRVTVQLDKMMWGCQVTDGRKWGLTL